MKQATFLIGTLSALFCALALGVWLLLPNENLGAGSTAIAEPSEKSVPQEATIVKPTGEALETIRRVSSVVFSPDGRLLAAVRTGVGEIEVQDTVSGKRLSSISVGAPVATPDDIYNNLNSVAFSPDGSVIATATGMVCIDCNPKTRTNNEPEIPPKFSKVQLWNSRSGRLLYQLKKPGTDEDSYDAAFSPDGKTLAVVKNFDPVQLWDVKTGQHQGELAESNMVMNLAYSPDGRILVGGRRGSIWWLWDARAKKKLRLLEGKAGSSFIFGFSADGKTLHGIHYPGEYWSGERGIAAFWDVRTGRIKRKFPVVDAPIAFSPTGNAIAAVVGESIKLFNVSKTGQVREKTLLNTPPIDVAAHHSALDYTYVSTPYVSLHFSPDSKLLAVGTAYSTSGKVRRRQIRFFDVATGKVHKTSALPSSSDRSLGFSPHSKSGEVVLATTDDRSNLVKLWRIKQ